MLISKQRILQVKRHSNIAYLTVAIIIILMARRSANQKIDQPAEKRSKLMIYNPYPKDCPRSSNMTALDVEENYICILRRSWYDELRNISSGQNVNNGRRSASNLKQFVSARPYTSDGKTIDCLHKERNTVRYVPGECYSKKYEFVAATPDQNFENTWWNFAAEILGDLMYTFDFVLWSTFPNEETNQFWYLILYLKEMALAYENPLDIVGRSYHEAYVTQLKDKLNTVKTELKKRQEDYRILDHTLKELKITMASYQTLMTELQNRMSKVVSTLPFEQANQELLLHKLDNASDAANTLERMFRRSNFNNVGVTLDDKNAKHQGNSDKSDSDGETNKDNGSNSDTEPSSDKETSSKNTYSG